MGNNESHVTAKSGTTSGTAGPARRPSLLSTLQKRTSAEATNSHPPNRDLSDDGRDLFAETMTAEEAFPPQGETPPKVILAQFGISVLNAGFSAGNKARIQDFAARTSVDCSDCVDGDPPRWCGLKFSVFMCDDCAGAHRSLPATISGGVRSLYLDEWSDEQINGVTSKGGNVAVNEVLEYHVPEAAVKPRKGVSTGRDRKRWMREKYEKQAYAKKVGVSHRPAIAALPPLEQSRAESFTGGKQVMVGVLDVTVVEVRNMPKTILQGQRLFGGFVLRVQLGRFKTSTPSTFSGRKWLGKRLHLSWDGVSPLQITIETGTKRVFGRASHPLKHLSGSGQYMVNAVIVPGKDAIIDSLARGVESITVVLRLDFIDLRT